MKEPDVANADRIVNQARLILAGHPPGVQSAALADLLSMWLAGHIIQGAPGETDALRERLLEGHIALVRRLLPVNAAAIHGAGA